MQPDFAKGNVSANRMQNLKTLFKSYAEVQPDFAKGNVSANRMQNLKTRFQKLC